MLTYLLIVEKYIIGGICHVIHQFTDTHNKYMKDFDPDKESYYLVYLDVNSLYGWAMSEALPLNYFQRNKNTFRFDKDLIKNYDKESYVRYCS